MLWKERTDREKQKQKYIGLLSEWKWNFYDFIVFRLSLAPMSSRESISLSQKILEKKGKNKERRGSYKLETFSRAEGR